MAWEYNHDMLITLCNKCHSKFHGKDKKNWWPVTSASLRIEDVNRWIDPNMSPCYDMHVYDGWTDSVFFNLRGEGTEGWIEIGDKSIPELIGFLQSILDRR